MDSSTHNKTHPVPVPPSAPPDVVREVFPGFALPEAVLHSIPLPEEFRRLLAKALEENRVKTILPKYFNPIFRRQGVVNKLALGALESVGQSLERLAGEIENRDEVLDRLVQHVNAQNAHTHRQQAAFAQFSAELSRVLAQVSEAEAHLRQHLESSESRRRRGYGATLSALRVLDRQLTALRATVDGTGEVMRQRIEDRDTRFEEKLAEVRREFAAVAAGTDARLAETRQQIAALAAGTRAIDTRLVEAVDATGALVEALESEHRRAQDEARAEIGQLRTRLEQTELQSTELLRRCSELEKGLEAMADDAAATRARQSDLAALAGRHDDLSARVDALATRQGSTASDEMALLRDLRERLAALVASEGEDRARAAAEVEGSGQRLAAAIDDAFYVALENRFRGSRDAIRERLSFYLPEIEATRARIEGLPQDSTEGEVPDAIFKDETFNVLDLGCGRGEWLRLLARAGIPALGVDLNKHFLAECARAGVEARLGDIFEYIRSLPGACVGAITCFHVIEHLGIGQIRELFHQAFRVLRRGGVAIFETPHAGNLVTSALNFHLDPTHHKPVHHLLARFVAETAGFAPVRTEFLHPNEDGLRSIEHAEENLRRLGDFIYGPQDFGLIAVKP